MHPPSRTVTLQAHAPAKINLFLHVVGRRPDGYHLLESIFCPVSLFDVVTIEITTNSTGRMHLRRSGPLQDLPEHIDLTAKAVKAFFEAAQLPQHGFDIHLHVEKQIPEQAGMGGGSSDAASTLKLLQNHFQNPIPPTDLEAIALRLGADVPFFLNTQSAFVEGIGESISPFKVPNSWLLVYKPQISCPTHQIFSDSELTRDESSVRIAVFDSMHSNESEDSEQTLWKYLQGKTNNGLQAVVERQTPEWKNQFNAFEKMALEHDSLLIRMTGSGSAMFAVFNSQQKRDKAYKNASSLKHTLSGHWYNCQIESGG